MEKNIKDMLDRLHRLIIHVDGHCKNPETQEVTRVLLYQQYFDEKVNIINKIYHDLDLLSKNGVAWEQGHLTKLEKDMQQQLSQFRGHMGSLEADTALKVQDLIEELENNLKNDIDEAKKQAADMVFTDETIRQLEQLGNSRPEGEHFGNIAIEELSQLATLEDAVRHGIQGLQTQAYQLRNKIFRTYNYKINQLSHNLGKPPVTSIKNKSMERYIGLNIINVIGILLLIAGTIAAGRLGHIWVAFVLGAGFLAAGEMLNRRRPNVFSLGLTAGGLGISYVTLAIGHFFLENISIYPALGICVALTALAFYLSNRYNSQTLIAITLVGGYFPILTILPDLIANQALVFGMMGYFLILNLLVLAVSLRRKWTAATFVGLVLNIIGVSMLSRPIDIVNEWFIWVYSGFALLIYTVIPIISTGLTKIKFTEWDTILVATNAFFGSIVFFIILYSWGWWNFAWVIAAFLTAFYGALSFFVSRKFEDAKPMTLTFLGISVAFTIFLITLKAVYMWVSPVLAALATALAIFGIIKPNRLVVIISMAIGGVALGWYFILDMLRFMIAFPINWFYITIQSASLTLGSLIVLIVLATKNQLKTGLQKSYKCATLAGIWFFVAFMAFRLLDSLPPRYLQVSHLLLALMGIFTIVYALVINKIPKIKSTALEALGITFNVTGVLLIFMSSWAGWDASAAILNQLSYITATAIVILILANAAGIFAVYNITKHLIAIKSINPQWLPTVVSTYFIASSTITLTLDFGITFASFWLSVGYMATALILVILGFNRHSPLLRRAGIGISLVTVLKLIFFDLILLPLELRIWSYFIIGGVLVGISYVYQYFSKRLDKKEDK